MITKPLEQAGAALGTHLDKLDEADESIHQLRRNCVFHFAGGFIGELVVGRQDLDEELTQRLVAADHVAGRFLAAGGEGDQVVRRVVDEVARRQRFESAGDRRVADLEELGNVLGAGGLLLPHDVKNRFEIVFEAGAENVFCHRAVSKIFGTAKKLRCDEKNVKVFGKISGTPAFWDAEDADGVPASQRRTSSVVVRWKREHRCQVKQS